MATQKDTPMEEFDPYLGGNQEHEDIIDSDEPLDFGNFLDDAVGEEETHEDAPQQEAQPQEDQEAEPAQDETEEVAVEASEPEPESDHDDETHIPKSRLEREAAKRRELEEMNRRLQQQMKDLERSIQQGGSDTRVSVDIDDDLQAQAQKIFEAIGDENLDDASKMFNDVIKAVATRAAETAVAGIDERIERGAERYTTSRTVTTIINKLKSDYPELDESAPEFNQDYVDETLLFQRHFIEKGLDAATALERAAQRVLPAAAPTQTTQATPPPKRRSTREAAEVANAQPPKIRGQSTQADTSMTKIDIAGMSDEEFTALAAKELKKMRGDFL